MTEFYLGVDTIFGLYRYPEPEQWTRIVGEELGLRYAQFVDDFFPLLPKRVADRLIQRIKKNCDKYNLKIDSTFSAGRANWLAHPDSAVRRFWLNWYKRWAEISGQLGGCASGAPLGIYSVKDYENGQRRKFIEEEMLKCWVALSRHAKKIGLKFLLFEPMSVPRETASTIKETERLLRKFNKAMEIPLRLCLDTDHGNLYGLPRDRDPYKWLEELGRFAPVIHLKQSLRNTKGMHWPFTPEYNQKGIIKPEKVLKALEKSGSKKVLLLIEIYYTGHFPYESRLLSDLKASVKFWRQYVQH